MRTIAMFIGTLFVLSFFAFAWLSHAGVLPGSWTTHLLTGIALFAFTIGGAWLFGETYNKVNPESQEGSDGSFLLELMCIVGMLNGFVFSVLRPFSIVGPENLNAAMALWIFYAIISFFSGLFFYKNFVKESED